MSPCCRTTQAYTVNNERGKRKNIGGSAEVVRWPCSSTDAIPHTINNWQDKLTTLPSIQNGDGR